MRSIRVPQTLGAVTAGAALALSLGACGGGNTKSTSATTPTTSSSGTRPTGSSPAFPGTVGQVAAISGNSMEVQNPQSGQVTVSWTGSTVFSKTTTVAESAITAGDCVTATGTDSNGTITASTVTVTQPDSSGSCTANRLGGAGAGGFGGGPGAGAGFRNGSRPAGSGSASSGSVPSRPAGLANIGFASGKITSVSPTALVVYGVSSSGFRRSTGSTSTSTSLPSTSVTIQVTSSTRYTETQSATASDIAVNDCVTANGATDTTGAVTARSVRISAPGPQGCSAGFGRGAAAANG